ncbi:peptidase M56 [Clostridium chromiireducens]|uniref:Peptidase M56 n=1 Tax=Clostridium chromiireducens TaxID=225345 RepID=A0A399IL16_9CLOT|nr:M56 family metallopeptidase [Clostridium chromiireducens]RII32979.1 peptidase M56 [Clostridium chromiireducens]
MDFFNIFEIIILSSLVGSIIALMILIIKRIFRDKLNPTFHYYIWLILLIKLIIPFGPENSLNFSNIYQNSYIQNSTNENSQTVQIGSVKQPQDTDLENLNPTNSFNNSDNNKLNPHIYIPFKKQIHIEKLFFFLWILGVVLLIWIFISAHKKFKQIVGASIKDVDNTHKEILYNCMNIMNIKTVVELLYCPKINSPSLCGLIKPKILIPINIVENIDAEDFKYIIMHELTHLKKKDLLINWIITLLSIIYWFNPIVLYCLNKMRKDCEFSCDNHVISYLKEGENIQYGNVLIKVLELCGCSNRLIYTTSLVMNNSEIKRRIFMISRYKKINFKGILLGTIIVVFISSIGIEINTSKPSIANATTLQTTAPLATFNNIVNNASNETTTTTIKKLPTDYTNPITPFSSDIVIYNSHADEDYPSGINVTDVGALINTKLVNEGLKSNFIKCTVPEKYADSYQNSRNLITADVKNYSSTILLDIHRDTSDDPKSNTRKILFAITKNNPYYEESKKFAECLSQNINNSNQVKTELVSYNRGQLCFNQDLSKNSVLIDIGNNMSNDSDIETCVNALVSALKKTQKDLSN